MRKGCWEMRAMCKCGWHTYAPFGDLFHVLEDCCPCCGNPKPEWASHYGNGWSIKVMRWVSKSKWYRPKSWNKGYWEIHKNSEDKKKFGG